MRTLGGQLIQVEMLKKFSLFRRCRLSFIFTKFFFSNMQQDDIASTGCFVPRWLSRDCEHEYLKEVEGDRAIEWVKSRNDHCIDHVGRPNDSPLYERVLSILDSKEKIPHVRKIDDHYYNFWQDKNNARGLWRRTTLSSFKTTTPDWETVIDFDALGKEEGESWVYKGHTLYVNSPEEIKSGIKHSRTLLKLSKGGSDAVVVREFDLQTKSFVTENGFILPESKSNVDWKSIDVILVGTDLKDGLSTTDSGYPRVVREWTRGTPLTDSIVKYEGEKSDVSVSGYMSRHGDHIYERRRRGLTFYTALQSISLNGIWHKINVQDDAEVDQFADNFLIKLRSEWVVGEQTFPQGTLLAVPISDFILNEKNASFTVLFQPTSTISLEAHVITKDYLILEALDTVKCKYSFWEYVTTTSTTNNTAAAAASASGTNSIGTWRFAGEEHEAMLRGSSISGVNCHESNEYWLTSNSFLNPTSLSLGDAAAGVAGIPVAERLKSLPPMFDASGLLERQLIATSADGTKIPYFIIHHQDMPLDGSTPTLLYGYGGFEISLRPDYAAVVGSTWLNHRTNGYFSCYVFANIRGGGEFGPSWHQAALRENRKLAYDDFIAVAEDLIARNITSTKRLGIRGGSNGGLLMGNMMVRRPDLFGAVCCAVPLLDMRSYSRLLAGASWMAEYGDPDKPEDWEFLQRYSAYHNINPQLVAAGKYPPLLMTTSTKDDRVHPYHARSFIKRLLEAYEEGQAAPVTCDVTDGKEATTVTNTGSTGPPFYYYENMEGGHGGAADNKQQAYVTVLYMEFLKKTICP